MMHASSVRVVTPAITLGDATITVTYEIHVVAVAHFPGTVGGLEAEPRSVTVTSSGDGRTLVLAVGDDGTSVAGE